MNDVRRKAMVGILRLLIVLGLVVFVSAGTVHYWQGWVCLAVFFAPVVVITAYLMRKDPELLARRIKTGPSGETDKSQKVIQTFAGIAFFGLFMVSALDHRFGWSFVPEYGVLAGDALVVLGFALVFWVFRVNTYTSGVIEVAEKQSVVTTGPYSLVRHPMYFGVFVMLLGVPPALGSWWGLMMMIPMVLAFGARSVEEEKFLVGHLPGYLEYRNRTRYQIVPSVW
jgi:protein-S-isoprenylcysteine O-methyltransferase Ste14